MRRIVLVASAGVLGCVPYGPGVSSSVAGSTLGITAVGATAVYRRQTGGCWANCQTGRQCDKDSGMCVPIPCGGCRADEKCVPSPRGEECVPRRREMRAAVDAGVASAGETDAVSPATSSQVAAQSSDAASVSVPPPAAPSAAEVESAPRGCPRGMAEIAGGTFLMGDARGERDQKPAHRVTLSTFCLDIKEVTVAEYAACSRCSSPGGVATSRYCNADLESARAHPVNCVTWEQARTYCEVQGKTLPTEAQWEYAARGGAEQRRFPWGKMRPSESNVCWARTYHAPPGTCPVGSFPPEAFGLTDMGGNVREWVADWYGPYPNLELHDPSGPASATERVVRGGGWPMNMESGIVTVYRGKLDPEYREAMLGFRCAGKLRPDV